MTDVKSRLDNINKYIIMKKLEFDTLNKNIISIDKELHNHTERLKGVLESCDIVQRAALDTYKNIETSINHMLDIALQNVFEDSSYKFRVKFYSRGKTTKNSQTSFELVKNGVVLSGDLRDLVGGGVVQLIGIALRLTTLILNNQSKIICFDEPATALRGNNFEAKLAALLKNLSTTYGVQIIMVTHEEAFKDISDKFIIL